MNVRSSSLGWVLVSLKWKTNLLCRGLVFALINANCASVYQLLKDLLLTFNSLNWKRNIFEWQRPHSLNERRPQSAVRLQQHIVPNKEVSVGEGSVCVWGGGGIAADEKECVYFSANIQLGICPVKCGVSVSLPNDHNILSLNSIKEYFKFYWRKKIKSSNRHSAFNLWTWTCPEAHPVALKHWDKLEFGCEERSLCFELGWLSFRGGFNPHVNS